MLDKLIELLRESVLIQAVMAFTCLGVMAYLAVVDRPIPEIFAQAFWAMLAYYFGSKASMETRRALRELESLINSAHT